MSRSVKESEDEIETKIGRRLRAVGNTSVVDSPLRRSTRNKQPINHDDGSSPESIASDATGPPMRNTKRKTSTVEYVTSDHTRALRPRRNSTASDTTDNADGDASRDMKKRTTRRSVAAVPSVETPTKTRLRRSMRAGSESNTASPSFRTTRRTRASSVDLEDSNDAHTDRSILHLHTPLKTRNRASALPSEPSVIEESDHLLRDEQDCSGDNDSRNTNASELAPIDNTRSPFLRLNLSDKSEMNGENDKEDSNVMESTALSMKLCDNVSESPSNVFPKSSKLKGNSMCEQDLPKVVLYKADFPITRNPKNKENEETQAFTLDENSRSSNPNVIQQRRSTNFLLTKKAQVKGALNRSVDDTLLANVDCQTMSESPSPSSNSAKSKEGATSIDHNSSATTNIISEIIDTKNESIIIIEEKHTMNGNKEGDENVDNETTYIDTHLQDESLQNISQEPQLYTSVMEIDTTADNHVDDCTANGGLNIPMNESSDTIDSPTQIMEVVEKSYSTEAESSQNMVEKNISSCSPKSPPSNDAEDKRPAESTIEATEASNIITSGNLTNTPTIRIESVVGAVEDNNEDEDSTRYDECRSQSDEHKSTKTCQPETSPNKKHNYDRNNVVDDENVETDVENLFQDILADEWKTDRTEELVSDTVGSSKRESLMVMQRKNGSKIVETSENDSDDTVIMQTADTMSKNPMTASHSTLSEGNMNAVSHDDDTEVEQETKPEKPSRKKSFSKTQNDSVEKLSKDIGADENEFEQGTLLRSKSRKNSSDTKSSDSASRRSLNIVSSDSNREKKMRRRTIEKMNFTKYQQPNEQSIPDETSPMEIDEDTNCDEKTIESSVESSIVSKKRSFDGSVGEKTSTRKSIDRETNRDSIHSKLDASTLRKMHKEEPKSKKDRSRTVETDTSDSDSNNESKQATLLPDFIFNVSTSEDDSNEDDSASMDSDVERELNLNGDSISKYSDDDVAGDECRASETEDSEDEDEDDDDDGMANFIVDDDEDVEEEESSEENVSDNDEDSIELELEKSDSYKTQSVKSTNTSGKHSSTKAKSLESSSSDEEQETTETDKSATNIAINTCQKLSPEKHTTTMLMDTSTPEIRRKSLEPKIVTTPGDKSMRTPMKGKNSTIPAGGEVVDDTIHESSEIIKTSAKKLNNSKLVNTSTDIFSPNKSLQSKKSKQKKPKSPSAEPLNHSMQIAPIESPEVKQLMSEKLNASLPPLKLQGRILKISRKSSLINVEEVVDEHNDLPSTESMLKRIKSPATKTEMKKTRVHQITEELATEEQNVGSGINNESKMKKKKKSSSAGNDTKSSEEEIRKKKKNNKPKVEQSIDENPIDAEPSCNKKSKRASALENQSVTTKENARRDNVTEKKKKSKKDTSADEIIKSQKNKPLKLSATSENALPPRIPNVKRLSEDFLDNIAECPPQPKKRMKLDLRNKPSKTMFNSKEIPDNLSIEDVGYIPISASGATSQFTVVNLKKINTKRSKKSVAALTFRERLLQRNKRQPISAYLMYQQKLKASGKDKY